MERTQLIVALIVIVMFGVALLAVVLWRCHLHLRFIRGRVGQIPEANMDVLLEAVEGNRIQTSSTGDELRGQLTIIKDRLRWATSQIDHVLAYLKPKDLE